MNAYPSGRKSKRGRKGVKERSFNDSYLWTKRLRVSVCRESHCQQYGCQLHKENGSMNGPFQNNQQETAGECEH
eukprot:1149019-Pelagomonas_calceolata.AAC.1